MLKSTYSSDRVSGVAASNVPFVVTRSVMSATMDLGVGHGGLVTLRCHLDMSAMTSKTYTSHVKVIASASMVAASSLLDDAVVVVRNTYIEWGLSTPIEDGLIDLAVSFDGSWMTRGYNSKYGLGCVIKIETGLVLDFVIMSLYCHSCAGAAAPYGGAETGVEASSPLVGWRRRLSRCCGNAPLSSLTLASQQCCLTETQRRTTTSPA